MSAIATLRVKPSVEVLPDPTDAMPNNYSIVSPAMVPVFAGHWAKPGEPHAGMWVIPFSDERFALSAVESLRKLGHVK